MKHVCSKEVDNMKTRLLNDYQELGGDDGSLPDEERSRNTFRIGLFSILFLIIGIPASFFLVLFLGLGIYGVAVAFTLVPLISIITGMLAFHRFVKDENGDKYSDIGGALAGLSILASLLLIILLRPWTWGNFNWMVF